MHAGPPGVEEQPRPEIRTLARHARHGRRGVSERGRSGPRQDVRRRERVAVAGYDPVSYFQAEGPLRGSASHEVEHDGALYRFANEENAAKFRAEPERYMPQYGGFCAYGMTFGSRSPVDPLAYRIHDDKLYIMINQGTTAMWQSRKKVAIPKADAAWRHLRSLGE